MPKTDKVEERHALSHEEAIKCQKLFINVVMAAIDEAIEKEKKNGTGVREIADWAKSKDGQLILSCAGMEQTNRVILNLQSLVRNGIKTSKLLGWKKVTSANTRRPK